MNEHFDLSICIPTRNQPDRLKITLASVIKQLSPRVEVLIMDDSDIIAQDFADPSLSITHSKGPKKGVDPAIYELATVAKGRFIWFLGDDIIVDGGVQKVLNLIKQNVAIDFYWLNSAQTDEYIPTDELNLEIFKNKNLFITKLGDQLGFLSCLLIRKSTILPRLEKDKIYFGTQWISIYFALKSISNSRCIGLVTTALLGAEKRDGPSHWYDVMQVFGINLPKIYRHFLATKSFSRSAINIIIRSNLISLVKTIFVGKATNSKFQYWKNKRYISILFKEHKYTITFYALLPILILPRVACKPLYTILKWSGYKTPTRFSI